MKVTADKNGNIRFLTAKLGWKERFDPREIEMLSAGTVPGLIPPSTVQGRKNNVMKFNITPYSTLEFQLSCVLSREQFADLLLQCIDILKQMQGFFLNHKNLVLDLDKIYVQLENRSVHFIYLPLRDSDRKVSLPDFFTHILQKAERSTYEQASFLEACLAWIGRPTPFLLEAFEGFIRSMVQTPQAGDVRPPVGNPGPAWPVPGPIYTPQPMLYGPSKGDTVNLAPTTNGGTVPLSPQVPPTRPVRFSLVRSKTGEHVEMTGPSFLVGTEAGRVSYCIGDNAAVSRQHALFTMQDGVCSITDQNSTNKTYVNNCMLSPHVPQVLSSGDCIRLANEDFTFTQETPGETV